MNVFDFGFGWRTFCNRKSLASNKSYLPLFSDFKIWVVGGSTPFEVVTW